MNHRRNVIARSGITEKRERSNLSLLGHKKQSHGAGAGVRAYDGAHVGDVLHLVGALGHQHIAEELGVKNATLMWPVRIAAAGKLVTPGGAVEICQILGKEETLRRLRLGIQKLS